MKTTLGERLKLARDFAGFKTQEDLVLKSGIKQGTISKIERGDTQATRFVVQLASACGVSPEWLATGQGEMAANGSRQKHLTTETAAPYIAGKNPNDNVETGPRILGKCPLISWVRAGELCEAMDPFLPGDAEDWLDCPVKHSKSTYVLLVRGDSMDNGDDGYRDGEHIFVDPDVPASHNDDVVARTPDGTATFKRLQVASEGSYLMALNPHYPERIIKMPADTVICGVVIYSGKTRRNR